MKKDKLFPTNFYLKDNYLLNYNIDKELFFNKDKLNEYVINSLKEYGQSSMKEYLLCESNCFDVEKRRTTRNFSNKVVSYKEISSILNVLSKRIYDGLLYANYPSAGGLYPVDVYLYVKDKRVECIDSGIYKYNSLENKIIKINNNVITKKEHFFSNKNVFESSAFSLLMVSNIKRATIKYGEMGYYFSILEVGILIELLSYYCEKNLLGSCCIGNFDFKKIDSLLNLTKDQVPISIMEIGHKEVNYEEDNKY